MFIKNKLAFWLVAAPAVIGLTAMTSCSGKKEEKQAEESRSMIEDLARQASGMVTIDEEAGPVKSRIESAGYKVVSYEKFVAQELGKQGRLVIYEDGKGKSGGVIYATVLKATVTPVWHWYFEDDVPSSVTTTELNDDGLWDVRIKTKKGEEHTYLQDQSFTMVGGHPECWMANNGAASQPVSEGSEMWQCFDGDSTTTWRTASKGAFIEMRVPFGVANGVLEVRTAQDGQPKSCTVYADGKKLQDVSLEETSSLQRVDLDPKIKGARKVRLEFGPAYGGGDVVALSGVGIK